MAHLRALHNHIIFQFEEEQIKHMGINQFKEETDWGFEFATTTDGMENARWVKVIAVGHEADPEIQPGMRVLVEKLMWTNAFQFEGQDYWRTDSDQVLGIYEPAT